MATYYVNKSGDDVDDGTTAATAWLTIQHAVDNIADGDTVIVQSGVYNENVVIPTEFNTAPVIRGDGFVVLSGKGIGGRGIEFNTNYSAIRLKNFIIDGNYDYGVYARINVVTFENCYLQSEIYNWPYHSAPTTYETFFDNCVVTAKAGTYRRNDNFSFLVKNSTFTKTLTMEDNNKTYSIENCYLGGDLWVEDFSQITSLDYNNLRGKIEDSDETYNTLSDFQNAYPDLAPHSINENGDFNNDYTLRWSSPNIGAGEAGTNIGARGPATYYESTDELFEGVTLTNVSRDANGNFHLDDGATTGTVLSAVLDFGQDITLGNLRMQTTETYPLDVIDSDIADSAPNRRNFEYRSTTDAEGSFAQDAADSAPHDWKTAERNDDLNLTCRYFQIRLILRDNGVEA